MPLLHTETLPAGAMFSAKRAERAVRFIEKITVHTKGTWSRKPFILSNWQAGEANWDGDEQKWVLDGIVRPLFGTVIEDEMFGTVRCFQMAWIELARKNGKSELMAALGLYLLIADGEESAEVYGAASDKDQAAQVFNVARDMIRLSPPLKRLEDKGDIVIIDSRKTIFYTPTRSVYRVVAADATGNLGANPSAILFDEVLAQPDEKLWDYLRQGFGTRQQPLLIAVTTAGNDTTSFCYREHEFSIKVAADPDLDPHRFVYMAYVDENADWTDKTLWPEANPGLGEFLNPKTLSGEFTEVMNKGDLSQIANFRQFRLNQWQKQANRWLDMIVWDDSDTVAGPWTDLDLVGLDGWGGLDLSETFDLTAWVMIFPTPERTFVLPRFWITRKALETRHRRIKPQMLNWAEAGLITIFEGDVIDYQTVIDDILADLETFNVRVIGYDQYQAPAVVQKIESRTDVVCVKVPQSTTRLNAGSKELTRLMGQRQLAPNGNAVLRWNADNAAYKQDSDGNIKPSKMDSTDKIDGISAMVNALTVKLLEPDPVDVGMYYSDDDICPGCGMDKDDDLQRCPRCGAVYLVEDRA